MEQPWYTLKDLFVMQQELRKELQETRVLIREYNGLRSVLNTVCADVAEIKYARRERYNVGKTVREWGGWIFGILSFVFTVWRLTQ